MSWREHYRGDGIPRAVSLGEPPPWRAFPRRRLGRIFQPPPGLPDVVNAALCLRRPLLITGPPGSGKSTVIESVSEELRLGEVLRWHITSRSTVEEALYRYDVLGRIHAQQLNHSDEVSLFMRLGPLGTALLPARKPRPLLIDELDKGDLDLAGDLLDTLERGEFEIPELARHEQTEVSVRLWNSDQRHPIVRGQVRCTEFPFIVMTSNGEREFPAPFLRRCVRYTMPRPSIEMIERMVRAHLGLDQVDSATSELVVEYAARLEAGELLAVDQLLNAIYLTTGESVVAEPNRARIMSAVLQDLART